MNITCISINVTPPNMNIPKNDIQSEAPRYNLKTPQAPQNKKNLPLATKTPLQVKTLLPLFVMECQRAITSHYQKEVVRVNEDARSQLAEHESHQASPPKSDQVPPERS